jgi:hypothetical protein
MGKRQKSPPLRKKIHRFLLAETLKASLLFCGAFITSSR